MADQAGSCARRDPSFCRYEIVAEKLIGVIPAELLGEEVPGIYFAFMHGLPADLHDKIILHRIMHQADHVAGGGVVRFLLESVRIAELTVFQSQFLHLFVHFLNKCLHIVLVAFVRILK